jgi:hypothetical protein
MNCKGYGRKRSWLNFLTFAFKAEEDNEKTPVSMASLGADI